MNCNILEFILLQEELLVRIDTYDYINFEEVNKVMRIKNINGKLFRIYAKAYLFEFETKNDMILFKLLFGDCIKKQYYQKMLIWFYNNDYIYFRNTMVFQLAKAKEKNV